VVVAAALPFLPGVAVRLLRHPARNAVHFSSEPCFRTAANALASARPAKPPKKASLPAACAALSFSSIRLRNSFDSTRTGRKKPGRQVTQRSPSRLIAAAADDHMHMVMGHRRAPGMEHRGGGHAGAQMLGVGGDGEQRLGRGLDQQVVDHRLVLPGDRRRQGEDDMMVGTGSRSASRSASHCRAAAP
jgi:hypothetical protein